ncbi:Asp-tRNA(Asn)/Glu-tRNA(Gln) amidotransferase subunit GatA [Patescibacteria group bacterium]|nr:Asp-tRNA(Asn)/Glu-tRNA(Gln) amidotransferase subunit GatA [Patescibacteria group bacterium]
MNIPLTIKQTQEGLLNKQFSAVELVDAYLLRIKTFDEDLNAFITVADELAYKNAKSVDLLIRKLGKTALEKHPLLGVVVAHKDIFLTKGLRTTAASKVLTDYVPAYSATVVERLEDAGCVTIGKTNCDAWAHGSSGENSDFGATKNPWDKKYVPGGSSSGSGAALAANFSLISTGTDTCGSIRLPANYCAAVGFKPTYGAVSRYGVIAMASSLDSVGYFAHCVDDVEKVFGVTRGEDGCDSTVTSSKFKVQSSKLRMGIPKEFFASGIEKEVEKSVLDIIAVLKKEGVEFVNISLPHTKYAISVYYIIQPAEVSSNLSRFDGIRYGSPRENFADEAKRRIMLGTYVLSSGYYDAYYLKAMKVRSIIKNEIDEAFQKVDAIIAPVAPTPPFKLGEKMDDPLQMYLTDIFAATANLSGIPSLAIPSGFTKEGLPLGFQLMGQQFSEPTLFELGKLYEKATNWKPRVAKL